MSISTVDIGLGLVERIRAAVIGDGAILPGPYGPRRVTYADYTASGRALTFVEDAIRDIVLPYYANTHTEASGTGRTTTMWRGWARRTIHAAVGGTDEHVVIFCGSGTTGAVAKAIGLLELGPSRHPVVFIGPYEHHSNELMWREAQADIVVVPADHHGRVDPAALDDLLSRYDHRPLLIGSFSAGSNVTGVLTDVDAVSAVLHRHGALALWDYAAAGPYVNIRMAESEPGRGDGKDAVFLSPHKFVGGPQTPGVLVVSRRICHRQVPTVPGGGTIAFVSPLLQRYLPDLVAREEGGTPAIVESVRAGMVFALKQAVGEARIAAGEQRLCRLALSRWRRNPAIELLGDLDQPRLPIVAFRIHHQGRLLHHNFVVAVLNDLFGIQARGGCSCAGPYGHRLLNIDELRSLSIDAEVERGRLGAKPGWTRMGFNYFFSDAVAEYLIEAVEVVAGYGHRLLPDYRFDPASGAWRHRDAPRWPAPDLLRLALGGPDHLGLASHDHLGEAVLLEHMTAARGILGSRADGYRDGPTGLPASFEALRDFHLPPESAIAAGPA